MFVQDFMIVERPAGQLVAEIESGAGSLLRHALGAAEPDLDMIRVKVGPDSWPALLAKTVEIRTGPVRRHDDMTIIAFSWRATGTGSMFPVLDADLEVSPLDEARSELALRGRYDPPGGSLGRGADRLLLHRLAHATVRAFLSSLASRLSNADAPA
jgi:hypothetical protein